MFSEGDEHQGVVIGVLFGVIALVIGLVIGLSVYQTRLVKLRHAAAAAPVAPVAGPAGVAVPRPGTLAGSADTEPATSGVAVIGPGGTPGALGGMGLAGAPGVAVEIAVVKIYFEPGQTALPPAANGALSSIAQEVLAGKSVSITGWYDAAGNATGNAELAKLRATHVRDLLASLGVPPERMQMNQSTTLGGQAGAADAQQAQRVEVRVH